MRKTEALETSSIQSADAIYTSCCVGNAMPKVRGRFIPEREHARPVKRSLDVLLWLESLTTEDADNLDSLEQLRVYLDQQYQGVCQIRLLVPKHFPQTLGALHFYGISAELIDAPPVDPQCCGADEDLANEAINQLATCARAISADCIVVSKGSPMLPFADAISKKFRCLLTDPSFLLVAAETFVRGFEIPWSRHFMIWNGTWDTFYIHAEPHLISPLMRLFHDAHRAGMSQETIETARSLALNRMPQVCRTRDKLEWFNLQRDAAKRDGYHNQTYLFEISYHLCFYYLLLSGTFDHLALLVNGIFGLALPDRKVGATYKEFLSALQRRSTELHGLFTSNDTVDFIARLAALRNLAAHRGAITPRKIVRRPAQMPTAEGIDQYLRETGNEWVFGTHPRIIAMARQNAAAEILEKDTIAEDMEFIEFNGKQGFVSPVADTPWNFAKLRSFTLRVAAACSAYLTTLQRDGQTTRPAPQ